MNQFYDVIGISGEGDALNLVKQREGVRTVKVNMTRKLTPLKDLVSLWQLIKVLNREKPYIVHTHTPKAGIIGMLAAKLTGVPNRLHTVAGLPLVEAKGFKRIILNQVEKITYACATKVYPNSYGLETIILDHKFTRKNKLKVIGNGSSNGIDTNRFDPDAINGDVVDKLRSDLGLNEHDFVFIYVGRIVKDKGINELVRAFDKLYKHHKQIKLLLVGPKENHLDPVSPEVELIIENHPAIITTGWQNDVRPYFKLAHALVFPSYREGFPNVVMQAAAMGLPSIVSDINGCNEIIQTGMNGVIVPPKNDEKLYQAMNDFVSQISKTVQMANNARKSILEKYDQNYVWNSILEEYKCLNHEAI